MIGRLGPALVLAVSVAVATVSGSALERMSTGREAADDLLMLPNGKHLRVASLGHAATLADLVYLWAIQYYANYERTDRSRYVEHVFSNVIAELDPHYVDPYWLGALILSLEVRDLDAALRVLDKGLENNPDKWIFPYLAGWECHGAGRFEQAAEYFARAAAVPGAPAMVMRARAGMIKHSGNLPAAARAWQEVLDDPRSDESSRGIALRQLRDLKVRIDLETLRDAVTRFRSETGYSPSSLELLARRGYIRLVPVDPDGNAYFYDPRTGEVGSGSGSVLGER